MTKNKMLTEISLIYYILAIPNPSGWQKKPLTAFFLWYTMSKSQIKDCHEQGVVAS
jgi:hypothetical protein